VCVCVCIYIIRVGSRIESEIIPSQMPMLLKEADEFEKVQIPTCCLVQKYKY